MPLIEEGNMIAGKYRLERALARGGMGSVWVAKHVRLDMRVAIKFMDAAHESSDEARMRFEREAKAAAQIQSPHVVQVHDYGMEGSTQYIVMELLQGEDLGARLRRERRLPLIAVSRILSQVAKALRKAHGAGLIHRDLKPANIFLSGTDEDEEVVKVLDFGVVKVSGLDVVTEATRTGVVVGSVNYMSPEQARGSRELDFRSDVWSLGVLAFRAIVGQHPFPGEQVGDMILKICTEPIPRPSEISPDLGPDVDEFFTRALARNVTERFQSARDFANELALLAGTSPLGASGTWSIPPPARQTLSLFGAPPSSKSKPPQPGSLRASLEPDLPTEDAVLVPSDQRRSGGGGAKLIAAGLAALTLLIGGWLLLARDRGASPAPASSAAAPSASASGEPRR